MRRRSLLERIAGALAGIGASGLDDLLAVLTVAGDSSEDEPADPNEPQVRTALVDRILSDQAVVLYEQDGEQSVVPVEVLPEPAREAGVVLRVPPGRSLAIATVDRAATARRREGASERFEDIAEEPPSRSNTTGSRETTTHSETP